MIGRIWYKSRADTSLEGRQSESDCWIANCYNDSESRTAWASLLGRPDRPKSIPLEGTPRRHEFERKVCVRKEVILGGTINLQQLAT